MKIVYGWNTFDILLKKPSILGLPIELEEQITIFRKQKYFHLFWIPVIPIGQQWVVKKKGDNDFYEPSPELNQYLQSLDLKTKTPWYSFALPILLILGFSIHFVHSSIKSHYSQIEYKEQQGKDILAFNKIVDNAVVNSYFTFKDYDYQEFNAQKMIP